MTLSIVTQTSKSTDRSQLTPKHYTTMHQCQTNIEDRAHTLSSGSIFVHEVAWHPRCDCSSTALHLLWPTHLAKCTVAPEHILITKHITREP